MKTVRVKMNLEECKKEMLRFRDFYGGDLIGYDRIFECKSKKQLKKILDEHFVYLEQQSIDAKTHLDNFIKKVVEF